MFREIVNVVELYNMEHYGLVEQNSSEEENRKNKIGNINLSNDLFKRNYEFYDTGEDNLWELVTESFIITVGVDMVNKTITGLSVVDKESNRPLLLGNVVMKQISILIADIFKTEGK